MASSTDETLNASGNVVVRQSVCHISVSCLTLLYAERNGALGFTSGDPRL